MPSFCWNGCFAVQTYVSNYIFEIDYAIATFNFDFVIFFIFSRFGLPVVFHTSFVLEFSLPIFGTFPDSDFLGLLICHGGIHSE